MYSYHLIVAACTILILFLLSFFAFFFFFFAATHAPCHFLADTGPPIISSDPVQYAVRGERGEVKCYIASTPPPDKIVSKIAENKMEIVLHAGTLKWEMI